MDRLTCSSLPWTHTPSCYCKYSLMCINTHLKQSPATALFTPVWGTFDKNYSVQLFYGNTWPLKKKTKTRSYTVYLWLFSKIYIDFFRVVTVNLCKPSTTLSAASHYSAKPLPLNTKGQASPRPGPSHRDPSSQKCPSRDRGLWAERPRHTHYLCHSSS